MYFLPSLALPQAIPDPVLSPLGSNLDQLGHFWWVLLGPLGTHVGLFGAMLGHIGAILKKCSDIGDHLGITLRYVWPDYFETSSNCFRRFLKAPFLIIDFTTILACLILQR